MFFPTKQLAVFALLIASCFLNASNTPQNTPRFQKLLIAYQHPQAAEFIVREKNNANGAEIVVNCRLKNQHDGYEQTLGRCNLQPGHLVVLKFEGGEYTLFKLASQPMLYLDVSNTTVNIYECSPNICVIASNGTTIVSDKKIHTVQDRSTDGSGKKIAALNYLMYSNNNN